MPVPIKTRDDVTPGTASTYVDVDVSTHVTGNTEAVLLHVINTSSTEYRFFVRENGSTDSPTLVGNTDYTAEDNAHFWIWVPVDANQIFEAWVGHSSNITIELWGYAESSEATFPTNRVSIGSMSSSWADEDISTITGSETAVAAHVLTAEDPGGSTSHSDSQFRPNGSTTDYSEFGSAGGYNRYMGNTVGVDANEIFEQRGDPPIDMWIGGWFTDNYDGLTNAVEYSTNIGAYYTSDLSSNMTTGSEFAHVDIHKSDTNIEYLHDIREAGTSYTAYYDIGGTQYASVATDASQKIQQRPEDLDSDLGFWGSWVEPTGGSPPNAPTNLQATLQ